VVEGKKRLQRATYLAHVKFVGYLNVIPLYTFPQVSRGGRSVSSCATPKPPQLLGRSHLLAIVVTVLASYCFPLDPAFFPNDPISSPSDPAFFLPDASVTLNYISM
jgi:hypothetical protein